jgi:hypothetical protein
MMLSPLVDVSPLRVVSPRGAPRQEHVRRFLIYIHGYATDRHPGLFQACSRALVECRARDVS